MTMEKKYVILGIIIIIILLIGTIVYFVFLNNEEFRITILNTSDEEIQVECFIFQDSEHGYNFTMHTTSLKSNESYTFSFKYEKSFNVYKIAIRAINYTYYSNTVGSERWNGMSTYMFLDGEVHDLLAVITPVPYGFNISNISNKLKYNIGNTNLTPMNITIVKMPEPTSTTTLDFSRDKN